jgi:hypothetical protein
MSNLIDMEKTVLISMPVEDLETLIIECVRTGLKYAPRPKSQELKAKHSQPKKTQPVKKEVSNG